MKKRVVLILLIVSALNIRVNAQDRTLPRITFGAEWSYIATLQSGWHYNYFSSEGYRVNSEGNEFIYCSNAEFYLHAGYNPDNHWNVALYIGMAGVSDLHTVMPVSVRGTYFFGNDHLADRWFTYIDLGSGISFKKPPQEILTGKIGGGYRLSLSRNTKLDFIASLRMTYTHPAVFDEGAEVPMNKINRNNAYLSALSLGMAITF